MRILSTQFSQDEAIPARFTCQGDDVSPPLAFESVPHDAVSLALVMDDPDAPMGTFDHWVLWNLQPTLREIPENWQPYQGTGIGMTSGGKLGYVGPCPPSGTHHYRFKLYALDDRLELPEGSSKAQLENAMKGQVMAQAELVGLYTKS